MKSIKMVIIPKTNIKEKSINIGVLMNDIDINLWRRALILNAKAQTNGETLGRNKL